MCSQIFRFGKYLTSRSQWPRGLRRRSAAARLLGLWVRIPPGTWMSVCCECCVLSGRGLCDGLITRPEESYRLWCVAVCELEKPQERGGHGPRLGRKRHRKKNLTNCPLKACKKTILGLKSNKQSFPAKSKASDLHRDSAIEERQSLRVSQLNNFCTRMLETPPDFGRGRSFQIASHSNIHDTANIRRPCPRHEGVCGSRDTASLIL